MCSTYDEGDLQPLRASKSDLSSLKVCMKCKVNQAQVVIRVNDAFCKDCFLSYCTHKFRSAFGKSKIVRDGERVLVAFSGGQASTSMLHLVQEGKSVRAQKKLRFIPGFIFVDDGLAYSHSVGVRESARERVRKTLSSTDCRYHIVKLEQLYNGEDVERNLTSLFHSASTLTAKEQLVKTLRNELISQIAKSEGYSKVIVGDTSTRLSAAILSNMAQGKGAHISYDTSLLDDRDPDLFILRPMKDFTSKEISLYNMFYDLHPEVIPTFTTKGRPGASIEKLTEAFVVGLQSDFPSTITTIMRTGDKLRNTRQADCESNLSTQRCTVCKAPLDTGVVDSSALGSLRFSEILSKQRAEHNLSANGINSSISEGCTETSDIVADKSCYSCQQMLRDVGSPELLSRALSTNRFDLQKVMSDHLLPE